MAEDDSEDKSTFFSLCHKNFKGSFDNEAIISLGTSNEAVGGIKNEFYLGMKGELSAALSWEAKVGTSFSWTKGAHFEFGSEAFSYHADNDLTAENGVEIKAGANLATAALLKQAQVGFGLAAAASLAGAASAFLMMEGFKTSDTYYSKGTDKWFEIAGTIVAALSVIGGIALTIWMHLLMKDLQSTQNSPFAAVMTLDKTDGIDISVNNTVAASGKFVARVATVLPANPATTSSLTIAAQGDSITLDNKGTAKIALDLGNTITLEKTGGGKVTLAAAEATIEQTGGGSATFNAGGAEIKGSGASAKVDAAGVKLEASNNIDSIAVTTTGLKLNFAGGKLKAGPLMINGAGIIQLG